jgi:hypothetical protein
MNKKNIRRAYAPKARRQLQVTARTDNGTEVILGWMASDSDQPWLDLMNGVNKRYTTDKACAITWEDLDRRNA